MKTHELTRPCTKSISDSLRYSVAEVPCKSLISANFSLPILFFAVLAESLYWFHNTVQIGWLMKERILNWFFGVVATLLLIVLAFLGWLKWLISALLIIGGIAFGYIGFRDLVNPKEKSTQTTLVSLALLGVMILLLTFSVLLMLNIIQPSLE